MTIEVRLENPHSEVAQILIRELSAELGQIYGTDGSAAFSPDDVTVARAAFVVAWDGEKAVGCGALRPMDNPQVAEVKRMYVRPTERGKGISHLILQKLEALASEYAYAEVWLETGIFQKAAIGLYASADYERMACYDEYVDNPESLCYRKALKSI